jgi:hypothetical protein
LRLFEMHVQKKNLLFLDMKPGQECCYFPCNITGSLKFHIKIQQQP